MQDPFSEETARRFDPKGVWRTYAEWPSMARRGLEAEVNVPRGRFDRVYVLGMGGSAAGGDVVAGWLSGRPGPQIEVFKGYVPVEDMSGSLAIACSVSGQTEETIQMLRTAVERGARAVSISSGGRLMSVSHELGVPHMKTPQALAPRYLFPFMVFSCVSVIGTAAGVDVRAEAEDAIRAMEAEAQEVVVGVPLDSNPSKKLALGLMKRTPAIYGPRATRGVGVRFKTIFNEGAKKHAYFDAIPDVFHNEIEAWEDSGDEFAPVFLRHSSEGAREGALTDRMFQTLASLGKSPVEVRGRGESSLPQLLTMAYRLDLAAYYVAIGLGRDPYPTKLLDDLKRT